MKKILITGANSYIGTSFENWLAQWTDEYKVDTIDMIDGTWRDKDFSGYDVVFHVAGIAHIREKKSNRELYYRINRDLAIDAAKKAKADGVKQFIYLSSMSVYGIETGTVTHNTSLNPKSHYGKSKLQAEKDIVTLEDDHFLIALLRPPMVYGKGCKGNYQTLLKYTKKFPIFPDIKNRRSMIYIDNLSEFVRIVIDKEARGLYYPQNKEYVCTSEMVRLIAQAHGKKIRLIKIFNPILNVMKFSIVNKVFGNLVYEKYEDEFDGFAVTSFADSITSSEKL